MPLLVVKKGSIIENTMKHKEIPINAYDLASTIMAIFQGSPPVQNQGLIQEDIFEVAGFGETQNRYAYSLLCNQIKNLGNFMIRSINITYL